ncbi:TPA: hypothetical protein N0F65_007184 [Lagenidium giganteum]|uniref:SCP domain-containing protein n=1 Tax=Lagenidium giganteum TaxID=4803 RepID=A0AAV2Z958_9STRA|nr:TPA: hypothetical protein N0F65_007184 [Lagenidium giganteum]
MKSWMNSPGNRASILNKNFKCFGMGYEGSHCHLLSLELLAQDFGSGSNESCVT